MIYDFIVNRYNTNENVLNNIAFIRKTLDAASLADEFALYQDCINTFLNNTAEDLEEQVKLILTRIMQYSAPLDNETTFRAVSEIISSLKFFKYDVYLIRRQDLTDNVPIDNGMAICYLLDLKQSQITNICSAIGREFDDIQSPINVMDATMTWFTSNDIVLDTNLSQICFIDKYLNDYANLKRRGMSLDFDASPFFNFLVAVKQKPILVTNILADEYEDL